MPDPTNNQTPPSTSSPSSSPSTIAQPIVGLQGVSQAPPNPPQPTITPGKAPSKKKGKPWKEVREWLNIIGILLIPLLIGVYTVGNNTQQTTLAQRQHDSDQHIAQQNRQADIANQLDQQRETALKTYEDDISSLLLYQHLATSRPGNEVRTVALAKTLEVLHQLDAPRNVRAIQFLQDAQLISANPTTKTPDNIIDFSFANLANDNLHGINLRGANLTGANLIGTTLSEATLSEATLFRTYLGETNLIGADLSNATLRGATLRGTKLSGAYLGETNLIGADLSNATLIKANLNGANLSGAYLSGANLNGADLSEAILTKANLNGAYLNGTIMPNGTRHPCQQGEEFYCK